MSFITVTFCSFKFIHLFVYYLLFILHDPHLRQMEHRILPAVRGPGHGTAAAAVDLLPNVVSVAAVDRKAVDGGPHQAAVPPICAHTELWSACIYPHCFSCPVSYTPLFDIHKCVQVHSKIALWHAVESFASKKSTLVRAAGGRYADLAELLRAQLPASCLQTPAGPA